MSPHPIRTARTRSQRTRAGWNRGRLRDNVVPLRPGLAGRQLADWQPGPAEREGLGCRVLYNQRIPVAAGITIAADVSVPNEPGRYPAVLCFAAYTKELQNTGLPTGTSETGSAAVFTDRGYVHIVASRRGMATSDGTPGPYFDDVDVDDVEAVIGWAAQQPWCNGEVAMWGTSYYGCTQLQAAVRRPPALKAFFANEFCTDYFRHIVDFGGTPAVGFLGTWMGANFTEGQYALAFPPAARAALSQVLNSPLKRVWAPRVQKQLTRMMKSFATHTPAPRDLGWYANFLFDGKTRAANVMPAGPYRDLANIEIPFVAVQNLAYFNLHQFGSYDLWDHAGTPVGRRWLILGEPEYALPVYSWQLEALAFFDHVLYGTDNGYAEQPPVRYWLDGDDAYVSAPTFPIPGAERVRYFLDTGGDDGATHRLTTEEPVAAGENRWAAAPLGATLLGGLDEVANPMLTFELRAEEEMELTGPVTASLRFSSNEIDSYVVARLSRIDAAGKHHLLSLGAISPARRRIDPGRSTSCEIAIDTDTPEPLVPGEPVTLRFSLTPAPTKLRPGERLRLDIASRTDLLKSDPSHGRPQFDMQVPPYFSRNTLHYGPDTYVEVDRV